MFGLPFFPLSKGISLMRKNELAAAISYFQELINKKIRVADCYFNIGRCYFKLDNFEKAKENLHKALDTKYSDQMARDILEITNWNMICSYAYYNNCPSFSEDGKKLAYISARRDTNDDGKISSLDMGGIYLADLTNKNERYIVSDDYYNMFPRLSPDGKFLAYLSVRKYIPNKPVIDRRANPGLYLFDLENNTEKQLLSDNYRPKNYSFSPDSKKIILSCWLPGNRGSGIYEVDISTNKVDELVPGIYDNTFPSLSKDGKHLIYSTWRNDTNGDDQINFRDNSAIYYKNIKDDFELEIVGDKHNNVFPSFSNDSRKVLFLSYRRDTNKDGIIDTLDNPGIYYYDLDEEDEYPIVNDKYFNKFASFVKGDEKIIFLSSWRKDSKGDKSVDYFENKGIYIADIYSRRVKKIVSEKYYGCYYPLVSPDGEKVAYVSWRKGTNRGLYVADLNKVPSKEELHSLINENL
jgi:Tol biopolymer transport system component